MGPRATAKLSQQSPEDTPRRGCLFQQVLELASQCWGDVEQWTERRWRRERVARADQHIGPIMHRLAEPVDQYGLADARLAGHQRHSALGLGRFVQQCVQLR
jgi:hypothetical protein